MFIYIDIARSVNVDRAEFDFCEKYNRTHPTFIFRHPPTVSGT